DLGHERRRARRAAQALEQRAELPAVEHRRLELPPDAAAGLVRVVVGVPRRPLEAHALADQEADELRPVVEEGEPPLARARGPDVADDLLEVLERRLDRV